jgi:Superfamily II DNA/RNA helicases, SNF2 family
VTALQLHDYQRQAVQFIQERRKAGLFLDMGLGKTAISLTALNADSLPALVTAPKRVAENVWEAEAALWRPDLRVVVAKGTPKTREAALASGADIVVIGRDNLADAVPHAHRFKTLIMDELSGWKSRASIRWKAAKKITQAPSVTHVWGLTGTPTPNGLLDLWPQMFLLDGGNRLGTTLGGYRERYFVAGRQLPNGVITEWNLRPGADKRIHKLLEDLCLSMDTDGKVDLPPVTYNTISVPLPPKVRQIYKSMKNDLVADMTVLGGEIHSAVNAAVLTSKLAQICAGFMYVDDADIRDRAYDVLHKEKVAALKEIVEGTGSQVLVAYRFQAELDLLKEGLGSLAHTLDEDGVIQRWNSNTGQVPVLLAHPASAGHGLNLQHGGHTMVWATVPWSLEEYMQMNKRLARQGQKHPVIIHHLIAPHTVDEAVLQRLAEKKSVQQALLDHLDSPL